MKRPRLLRILRSKRELARLNHILIPEKKDDRDRLRRRRIYRVFGLAFRFFEALSAEGRALVPLTILIGLAGVDVTQTQVHLLFGILAAVLLASLLVRPLFRADGLSVSVEHPSRVMADSPMEFLVSLRNEGPSLLSGIRVSIPFLPWDGKWSEARLSVAELPPGASRTLAVTATFMARGEHHLDPLGGALLVPLGLAVGRAQRSEGPRFLVTPKLANVVRVTLAQASRERDKDRPRASPGEEDFAGVRPYRIGDPVRRLHVRSWARTGIPHVKTYVSDPTVRATLWVGIEGEAPDEEQREAALSLAAGVASRLTRMGVMIDRIITGSEVTVVAPRVGRAALDLMIDRLALTHHDRPHATPPSLEARLGIYVSVDDGPVHWARVRVVRARGVALSWFVVARGRDRAAIVETPHFTEVSEDAITRGEPIAL